MGVAAYVMNLCINGNSENSSPSPMDDTPGDTATALQSVSYNIWYTQCCCYLDMDLSCHVIVRFREHRESKKPADSIITCLDVRAHNNRPSHVALKCCVYGGYAWNILFSRVHFSKRFCASHAYVVFHNKVYRKKTKYDLYFLYFSHSTFLFYFFKSINWI